MKRARGLRWTSSTSTSSPPAASRRTITEAATRGRVSSPLFSSSPGGGRSIRTYATVEAAVSAGPARSVATLSAIVSVETQQQWICNSCGFIYDPEEGDPDGGIPAGTAFEDIPDDWFCPVCGARKKDFEPYEG
jgi:rubredoxin